MPKCLTPRIEFPCSSRAPQYMAMLPLNVRSEHYMFLLSQSK